MSLYSIETYGELRPGIQHEWLLTNGIGSFASGTVVGCNTRRYHGLLCAATKPPVGRMMLLNRIGEIIKIDDDPTLLELSVNCFTGNVHPRGDRYLRKFELGDSATWAFDVSGVKVVKELSLVKGKNVAILKYTIDPAGHRVSLDLIPFTGLRDFHAERRKAGAQMETKSSEQTVSVTESGTSVFIQCDSGEFIRETDWWTGHIYPVETERGQDDVEDLFKPGRFVYRIDKPTTITLTIAGSESDLGSSTGFQPVPGGAKNQNRSITIQRLMRAAEDFIVARKTPEGDEGVTIIAGYPWFADWGRDTMISLPGLLLSSGRYEEAGKVLSVFARYVSQGMIPNRFDDYTNEPSYNTVDASLWFIHAVYEYRRLSKDQTLFADVLSPACKEIIRGYRDGTRYNIHMDPADGLIIQGDHTTQLTWMDAKMGDIVFTPRQGKAVEINALWYHALVLQGETALAERVLANFAKVFWISPFRGLCDVVNGDHRDQSIRPNQIFAASLPNSALNREQQSAVVEVVRRELLTPVGLRTLAASDPNFKPKYTGDQFHRDQAYHNGTIWPWPIGAFLDAYLRVNGRSREAMNQARAWLAPLIDHLCNDGCIGSISEIFEAEAPHRPAGCFAQAWSVAEVLRLAVELEM